APEGSSQTGNCGGVSNAGLVLHLDRAEGGVELLHQIVFLVVEGRSAQTGDPHGAPQRVVLLAPLLPGGVPGGYDAVGDHVQRGVQVQLCPLRAVRTAVPDLGFAQRGGDQLSAGGTFGAQPAPADGRIGVPFDLGDFTVFDVDPLA